MVLQVVFCCLLITLFSFHSDSSAVFTSEQFRLVCTVDVTCSCDVMVNSIALSVLSGMLKD